MQIHNMAEVKATQFLRGYYGWPTIDADTILAANPENKTNSNTEQEPEKREDNDKQGNEERGPSIKTTTLTQHNQMDGGTEPVDEPAVRILRLVYSISSTLNLQF
jgi:hypothetical protein